MMSETMTNAQSRERFDRWYPQQPLEWQWVNPKETVWIGWQAALADQPAVAGAAAEERSVTLQLTEKEARIIGATAEERELSIPKLFMQAIRLYQDYCEKLKAGEIQTWSGDKRRAAEFAGAVGDIEAVAEAIFCRAGGQGQTWAQETEFNKGHWRNLARGAIAALPTTAPSQEPLPDSVGKAFVAWWMRAYPNDRRSYLDQQFAWRGYAARAADESREIADLRRQLAERDAEVERLRSSSL